MGDPLYTWDSGANTKLGDIDYYLTEQLPEYHSAVQSLLEEISDDILDIDSDILTIRDYIGHNPFQSLTAQALGSGRSISSLADWLVVQDMWYNYTMHAFKEGTNNLLKSTVRISESVSEGTNTVLRALLSINNKLDNFKRGSLDLNIFTNLLIADSYRPITDPQGSYYYDYSQFLEMLANPAYIDTYMFYYAPWRYHLLNYLSYLPVGSAGGQSSDSLYLRPGESSYVNDLYLNSDSDHDTRYSWAYYDLYGTGEILRYLTNSVGVISMNNPVMNTPSNTVALTRESAKAVRDQKNEMEHNYTNPDDNYNIQTNAIEEIEDENVNWVYGDANSQLQANSLNSAVERLFGDFSTGFSDVVQDLDDSSSEDLILEMNLDLALPNDVSIGSNGLAILNVSEKLRTFYNSEGLAMICAFVFWFIRISYGCNVVHRLFDTLRKGLQS